jgi:hypothetical protein
MTLNKTSKENLMAIKEMQLASVAKELRYNTQEQTPGSGVYQRIALS